MRLALTLCALLVACSTTPSRPDAPAPALRDSAPSAFSQCANLHEVMVEAGYPREAARQDITSGQVLVEFSLTPDGKVTDVKATKSSHPIFEAWAIASVSKLRCNGTGKEVRLLLPMAYRLK